jgi:hypothetical protein
VQIYFFTLVLFFIIFYFYIFTPVFTVAVQLSFQFESHVLGISDASKFIVVKLLQPENAPYPMLVTLLGMFILVRLLQHKNALDPILIIPVRIEKRTCYVFNEIEFFTNYLAEWKGLKKIFNVIRKHCISIIKKYIENHNVKIKTIIANMRKCLLNEDFLIEVLAYYCSSL